MNIPVTGYKWMNQMHCVYLNATRSRLEIEENFDSR